MKQLQLTANNMTVNFCIYRYINFVSRMLQLSEILKEVNHKILLESQESKSQSAAIKYLMQKKGMSKEQANEFVREDLRAAIKILRRSDAAKFTQGVARMWADGEFDIEDKEACKMLDKVLYYASSDAHIEEYDRNLNGLSYSDLITRFSGNVESGDREEKEKLASLDYDEESSDYDIIPIHSFDEASEYSQYVSWCITHYNNMWNSYVGGDGSFYFCLKKGFEDVPQIVGEGCPLDEYGLSMIAVCIDDDQELKTCTCRWNHYHGGNDNIMTASQLCEDVLHVNFYDTFKPIENIDRSMSFDEYIELCDENLIWVIEDTDLVLSQDRDPYASEYEFDNSPEAILYLYDIASDSSSNIGCNTYNQESLILSRQSYAVLKSNNRDEYDLVYYNQSPKKYWQSGWEIAEDFDSFIEIGESIGVLATTDDSAVIYTTNYGFAEMDDYFVNAKQDSIKYADFGNIGLVFFEDDYMTYLYSTKGKCILRNELPANGEMFTIYSDGLIHCQNGHTYDLNGERVDSDTSDLKIKEDLGNGIAIVYNTSEYYGLYNTQSEQLLTKVIFNGFQKVKGKPFIFVEKGKLHNIINLNTFDLIIPEWGDAPKFINDRIVGMVKNDNYKSIIGLYDTEGNPIIPFDEKADYQSMGLMKTNDSRLMVYYRTHLSNNYILKDLNSLKVYISEDANITSISKFHEDGLNLYELNNNRYTRYLYDPNRDILSDPFKELTCALKHFFVKDSEYNWHLLDIKTLKIVPDYSFDGIVFRLNYPVVQVDNKANIIIGINGNEIKFFSKVWFDYISYYKGADYKTESNMFTAKINNEEFIGDIENMTLTNTATNETLSMLGESLIRKNCLTFKNKFDSIFNRL